MADQAEEAAAGRQDRRGAAPGIRPVRDPGRDGPDRGRTGGRLPDPERVL
ncbi:MAG: hypothetical protein OXN80_09400 [bacterium]|nr:hypothetical protein [bacterium]MDE0189301.1 hypothetical protein [bacterium]